MVIFLDILDEGSEEWKIVVGVFDIIGAFKFEFMVNWTRRLNVLTPGRYSE